MLMTTTLPKFSKSILPMTFIVLALVVFVHRSQAEDHVYGTVVSWGQLIDPDGDCEFAVSKDSLSIGFSGARHILDSEDGQMNAPRVLRSMQGEFAIQVTVEGNLPLPDDRTATAYVSGGLLLLIDEANYLRFERASFTRRGQINHYANFEQRIDSRLIRIGFFSDYPIDDEKAVDLRFEVTSGTVRSLIRVDGKQWHEMGTAEVDPDATYAVGVTGLNTSGEPVQVKFAGLQHESEFEPMKAESSSKLTLPRLPNRAGQSPRTSLEPPEYLASMIVAHEATNYSQSHMQSQG